MKTLATTSPIKLGQAWVQDLKAFLGQLNLLQGFKYLGGKLAYLLSGLLFPCAIRDNNKAVFGCYKNKFSDNSKYLYLHWCKTKFKRVIWISGDKALVTKLNRQGMEAYTRWSKEGVWHSLTAKYYFYCSYIGDINQYVAMGAFKINLWHGTPMKKIEFDIDNGPMAPVYQSNTAGNGLESHLLGLAYDLYRKLKYHQQYVRPDLMLSPNPQIDEVFISAFRLKSDQVLRSSNPRTDYYHLYPNERSHTVQDTQEKKLVLANFNQVILYAPSWRDNLIACNQENTQCAKDENKSHNPYKTAIDWQALSQSLTDANNLLLVRLHPNEAHLASELTSYPNIIDISQRDDVYDLLHSIDLLITDYSSLFIDVLPLNTPIVFFQFDRHEYRFECRSQYPYMDTLTLPGPVIYDFSTLVKHLSNIKRIESSKCNSEGINQFYTPNLSVTAFTALEESKLLCPVYKEFVQGYKQKSRTDN